MDGARSPVEPPAERRVERVVESERRDRSIALDGVTKRFGEKVVLLPTTLRVDSETCLALIGPSGCGKSTLLRIVIGLALPDGGSVHVGGERVERSTLRAIRLRMGYVIQDGGLFPHLTAEQNVTLMARELGWEEARVMARMGELAELLGLAKDALARYPAELSGGQRQRVGVARALMLDPDFLLMDEPLGALDPILRSRLQKDLKALFSRLHKTVLLVTHDMGEAAYLGDAIALMQGGRIVQKGPFAELAQRPADPFVREFIAAQRPPWAAESA